MSRMESEWRERGKTNWGWVLAGISMLGAFILLYVNPVLELAKENRADLKEHATLPGHPFATCACLRIPRARAPSSRGSGSAPPEHERPPSGSQCPEKGLLRSASCFQPLIFSS